MSKYDALFLASTDTVPGLGAPATPANQALINALKGSPPDKRLVIMVDSIAMARQHFAKQGFDDAAEQLAKQYWPGPTTLVCSHNLALRVPNLPPLQTLIKKLGPVYMTSANLAGEPPLSFAAAQATFAKVKQVYDFGPGLGRPSQIIDVHANKRLRD